MKYPGDWAASSAAYGSTLGGPERTGLVRHVLGLARESPHGDWSIVVSVIPARTDEFLGRADYYYGYDFWNVLEKENITAHGLKGTKVTWGNYVQNLFFQNKNGTFTVRFDGIDTPMFDQILSTFRFIE